MDKMKRIKKKIKYIIKVIFSFIFNPRLLLCFGLAWLITNGWAYVALFLGTMFDITWLSTVAGTYITLLWFPATPEKILTIIISIFLLKLIFPNDTRTLKRLIRMKNKAKLQLSEIKEKFKNRHNKK